MLMLAHSMLITSIVKDKSKSPNSLSTCQPLVNHVSISVSLLPMAFTKVTLTSLETSLCFKTFSGLRVSMLLLTTILQMVLVLTQRNILFSTLVPPTFSFPTTTSCLSFNSLVHSRATLKWQFKMVLPLLLAKQNGLPSFSCSKVTGLKFSPAATCSISVRTAMAHYATLLLSATNSISSSSAYLSSKTTTSLTTWLTTIWAGFQLKAQASPPSLKAQFPSLLSQPKQQNLTGYSLY